jgi:hypothetical protein
METGPDITTTGDLGYAQPRHLTPDAPNPLNPARFAKAIGAGVLAALGVLYAALADNQVSAQEWAGIAQAAAAAGAVVYGIPNKATA